MPPSRWMDPMYLVGWVRVKDLELFANIRGTFLEHDAVLACYYPTERHGKDGQTDRQTTIVLKCALGECTHL